MKIANSQRHFIPALIILFAVVSVKAQQTNTNKFRQMYDLLPTPNTYRTASGAPGHQYWQQQVDYDIKITLDDEKQLISGEEWITYHNNSPDALNYLWVQLDQNIRAKNSLRKQTRTGSGNSSSILTSLSKLYPVFDGGFKINGVKDKKGDNLPYTINQTMMRIELPETLLPGNKFKLNIKWWYNINDRRKVYGRSGMEYFAENDNYLYVIAQFYPRLAVYNDVEGWQNKQFLGKGEFTLSFGNYNVEITVPTDHIVSASGVLQNPDQVLTDEQKNRLEKAKKSDEPIFIVTEQEARKNEKTKASGTKTWKFKADNVRDFAFASSRKFIWDAVGVKFGDRTVMAMSFYPKEGNPLWEEYSTRVVAHTLKIYSKYTFDFPYPVAQSVHTENIGMEYPMICFNGGRPSPDGTYYSFIKYNMISVIIHEVGHNYFPMIVNSDERQWTWMDEGLNTFLQYLAEQAWEDNYPSWVGPTKIIGYMSKNKNQQMPIMTNSELILNFSSNAYIKPATALSILRKTVMEPEQFDYAFKTYAQRWKFKQPYPADFFRTMEDASAIDLDWFWRGWFYTTDHVDIAITDVKGFKIDETKSKDKEEAIEIEFIDKKRYKKYYDEPFEELNDFDISDFYFYTISFKNIGGLIMPLIVEFEYTDGTKEIKKVPAEIWRKDNNEVTKTFLTEKKVKKIRLDPLQETADVETGNNHYPKK